MSHRDARKGFRYRSKVRTEHYEGLQQIVNSQRKSPARSQNQTRTNYLATQSISTAAN